MNEKKQCIIPGCPAKGVSKGRGGTKEKKYRPYCGFHKRPANRNKYHPTSIKIL